MMNGIICRITIKIYIIIVDKEFFNFFNSLHSEMEQAEEAKQKKIETQKSTEMVTPEYAAGLTAFSTPTTVCFLLQDISLLLLIAVITSVYFQRISSS